MQECKNTLSFTFYTLGNGPGGVDETDMTERLREIADEFPGFRVDFFGQEPRVICIGCGISKAALDWQFY